MRGFWHRHQVLLSFAVLAVAVIVAFAQLATVVGDVRAEGKRARRAECEATNVALRKVRSVVFNTVGYQSPVLPGASPDLAAQVTAGNLIRHQWAVRVAKDVETIDCAHVVTKPAP